MTLLKSILKITMKNKYHRLCILAVAMTCGVLVHGQSRADSIRAFLTEFGEREKYIAPIIEHCAEYSFDSVYHLYIREYQLNYNDSLNKMEKGSHYLRINVNYIRNHMAEDDSGELMHLFTRLIMQGTPHDSVINLAEYYWYQHHIPSALHFDLCCWTEWKYSHKVDLPQSEADYLYYCMATYVLLQGKTWRDFYRYYGLGFKLRYRKLYAGSMIPYDKKWVRNFKNTHKPLTQGETDSYYYQFRAIHLFDDEDVPFVPSEAICEQVQETLDKGIEANELECIITKAFALITGTILDRNIEQGKQLLLSVWPQMKDSQFWDYVNTFPNDMVNLPN